MKIANFLILSALFVSLTPSMALATSSQPFVDDFENYDIGDDASSVWEELYSYGDGGSEVVIDGSQVLEVSRAYLWHNSLNHIFFAKMKVLGDDGSDSFTWYGSRLALVNPNNPLERYELRLYPNTDKIQVNYVDRTGRTGDMEQDLNLTTSEILDSADCDIALDKWHYVLIMRSGNQKWKAMVFRWNRPTCMLRWEDDRIGTNKPAIGIQSAGKYITSRFDEIFAI